MGTKKTRQLGVCGSLRQWDVAPTDNKAAVSHSSTMQVFTAKVASSLGACKAEHGTVEVNLTGIPLLRQLSLASLTRRKNHHVLQALTPLALNQGRETVIFGKQRHLSAKAPALTISI